jgi:hemerythrin
MSFVTWKESYSVGIPEADADHQHLFELINELHEVVERDGRTETIAAAVDELEEITSVIDELLEYASYHFGKEQFHMERLAYPAYEEHRQAHRKFTETVQRYRRDFDEGGAVFPMEIVKFLRDWLDGHILNVDKELGEFLRRQGVTRLAIQPEESRI